MMKRYGCAILVALFATVVAAGCGGDEAKPLSKAEYIKQGDAICKKSGDQIDKEVKESGLAEGGEPSEKEITTFAEETLTPALEGQVADLRDLPTPKGDEDTLDKLYEDVETATAKIEEDPKLLLQQGEDPFEKPNADAQKYGFKVCGEG